MVGCPMPATRTVECEAVLPTGMTIGALPDGVPVAVRRLTLATCAGHRDWLTADVV